MTLLSPLQQGLWAPRRVWNDGFYMMRREEVNPWREKAGKQLLGAAGGGGVNVIGYRISFGVIEMF